MHTFSLTFICGSSVVLAQLTVSSKGGCVSLSLRYVPGAQHKARPKVGPYQDLLNEEHKKPKRL